MTRNRKADLQRKLAIAPVPTPPDGLAGRIKSEIPTRMGVEPERMQLRSSVGFNLRIAASIILLISSLYLVLNLRSRTNAVVGRNTVADGPAVVAAPRVALTLPNTPPEPGSARVAPSSGVPTMPSEPPQQMTSARENGRMAEAKHTEVAGMATGAPAQAGAVEKPALTEPASERSAIVNAVPEPLAAPPSSPPPSDALSAYGAPGAKSEVRDLSRDSAIARPVPALPAAAQAQVSDAPSRNFVAIQKAIERGEAPRDADSAVIVQHFAAPERAPAKLHVELEVSSAPLDGTRWLLRVSVDAPASVVTAIDLSFGEAVSSYHTLAGAPAPNETALYEIEIKPNALADQRIASIRAGKATAAVRVADLHPWNNASARMKRASLAAAWAHTLQSRAQSEVIVAKARAAHFDDLADMAERAERIR